MVESGFNPNSVSRSGAMGLGQLMPGTARWMGVADPFDTTQNLYGSVKLLRQHLDKYRRQTGGEDFESLVLSLAAYNAGEGAVRRHGGVPPYRETQSYVRKVVGLYYKLAGM
jgi:soluble lytic murein transglycosylase-like protein